MCSAFNGTIQWVTSTDQSDPLFGISCTKVIAPAGGLSQGKTNTLFKLLRDFLEHPFP